MSSNFERALLLIGQNRPEEALTELQQHLGQSPDDDTAISIRALILCDLDRHEEAMQSVQTAIALDPESDLAHSVHAKVLLELKRYKLAIQAIDEAIRIDPDDASHHSMKSSIYYQMNEWQQTLNAAEQSLAIDPEDVESNNLRVIALNRLNRKEEANHALEVTMAKDPDNAFTHATKGWQLLEQHNTKQALHHFKESLRIDPTMDWARAGIVEALKAKNFIYRYMLSYFFWMTNFTPRTQMIIMFGAWGAINILNRSSSLLGPLGFIVTPLVFIYIIFVLMTWIASPLFNLLLRFDSYGRMALNKLQIRQANWLAVCLGCALASLIALIMTGYTTYMLVLLASLFITIPVTTIFRVKRGQARWIMTGVSLGLALLAGTAFYIGVTKVDSVAASLTPEVKEEHRKSIAILNENKERIKAYFAKTNIKPLPPEVMKALYAGSKISSQIKAIKAADTERKKYFNYFVTGIFISCILPMFLPDEEDGSEVEIHFE